MASVGLSRMIIDNQDLGWSAIARQRYWCSSYPQKYVQYLCKILCWMGNNFDPIFYICLMIMKYITNNSFQSTYITFLGVSLQENETHGGLMLT